MNSCTFVPCLFPLSKLQSEVFCYVKSSFCNGGFTLIHWIGADYSMVNLISLTGRSVHTDYLETFYFWFLKNSGKSHTCGVHSYSKQLLSNHLGNLKADVPPTSRLKPKVWGNLEQQGSCNSDGTTVVFTSTCDISVLLLEWGFRKYKFSSCVYIEKNLLFVWILFWPRAGPWKGQNINSSTSVHWRVMLHEDKMGFVSCFIVFCVDINKHGNLNNEP